MPTLLNRAASCAAIAICLFTMTFPRAASAAAPGPNLGTNEVPYAQDKPPGPALSPQEAMAKMQLAPGFKVELVAAEPDVVNPTAMTFEGLTGVSVRNPLNAVGFLSKEGEPNTSPWRRNNSPSTTFA